MYEDFPSLLDEAIDSVEEGCSTTVNSLNALVEGEGVETTDGQSSEVVSTSTANQIYDTHI